MAASKRRNAQDADATGVNLELAFAELRPAMIALAYRITGSRADAEDIVQDCFLRLHSAEPDEAVRSLKAYLATITARLSLNRLRDQRARRETYIGEWLPEPILTEDKSAPRAEDVSFALLVVLERLAPVERTVFVLRTAFELDFETIGTAVQRDAVTCRKIFSRARARVHEARPRFTVDHESHRMLLRGFIEAVREQDMDKLVSLFADNVVLHGDGGGKALATKRPVVGSVTVARFILAVTSAQPPGTTIEEAEVNGGPAIVVKVPGRVAAVIMIDTDGERIQSIFGVANPDKLVSFAPLAGTHQSAPCNE
jgi:RNA polymerase sigma-70 factor (ECF subfamily)